MKVLIRILIILLLGSNICFAQYQPKFTNIIDVSIDYNNYSISNENADEWAGVSSFNFLAENTIGLIEANISNGEGETAFGFSKKDVGIGFHQIDYCFLISQNQLFIYEKGYLTADLGGFSGGYLKIERLEGSIEYFLDGESIYRSEKESSELLVLDISVYNSNSLRDINCSFDIPFKSDISITNIDDENLSGSVTFDTNGDYGPFEYAFNGERYFNDTELQNFTDTNNIFDSVMLTPSFINQLSQLKYQNSFQGLEPIPYAFSVYDNSDNSLNFLAIIQNNFHWEYNTEEIEITDSKSNGYWDDEIWVQSGNSKSLKNIVSTSSPFRTYESFKIDSLLEMSFIINNANDNYKIGFVEKDDNMNLENLIFDYGVYLSGRKQYLYLLNSSTQTFLKEVKSGDIIKIQSRIFDGNQVLKVFINNNLVNESTIITLIRDIEYQAAGIIETGDIQSVSIWEINPNRRTSLKGTINHLDCNTSAPAQISISPLNLFSFNCSNVNWVGPNNFSTTGCSIICTEPGIYTASYTYNFFNTSQLITQAFYVGYKVTWTEISNAVSDIDRTINKNITGKLWNAGAASVNVLNSNTNGWVEYEFNHSSSTYGQALGFSNSNLNAAVNTIGDGILIFKALKKEPSESFVNSLFGRFPFWSASNMNNNLSLNNHNVAKIENSILGTPSYLVPNNATIRLNVSNSNVTAYYTPQNTSSPISLYTMPINQAFKKIIDISLFENNNKIVKPRVSFGCPEYKSYAIPKLDLDGGFHRTYKRKLHFVHQEEYNDLDQILSYKVYDNDFNPIGAALPQLSVNYGYNQYSIDFNSLQAVLSGYYILEVTNEKNEKKFLRFYLD